MLSRGAPIKSIMEMWGELPKIKFTVQCFYIYFRYFALLFFTVNLRMIHYNRYLYIL